MGQYTAPAEKKSVVGSETTMFIGGYFDVINPGTQEQAITKYYVAGGSGWLCARCGKLAGR
jgi:hypothetical protein